MSVNLYLLQFIPILLIIFYVHYEKLFAATFRSVLGRLILLIIIVFYTAYDKMVGAVVCLLVVMYYQQTDGFIETMVSMTPQVSTTDKAPKTPKTPTTQKVSTDTKTTDTKTTNNVSTDTNTNTMIRHMPVLSRFLPAPVTEPFDNWSPNQDTSLFTK